MIEEVDPQAFLNYMCRFLVSIGCNSTPPPNLSLADRKFFTSGFVLELSGQWYYVSSGHVFDSIAGYIDRHSGYSHTFVIHGGMGTHAVNKAAIEFTYQKPVFSVDRASGLDFGAIRLPPSVRQYLEDNAIIPVREVMWDHELAAGFSNYFAIGLPRLHMTLDSPRYASIQPVYLRLDSTNNIEPQYRLFTDRMRYFRVPAEGDLNLDLEGMSGCPVFALRENSGADAEVAVCALQSSWLPGKRFLAAVDLRSAASELRSFLRLNAVTACPCPATE
jgi:hypothetical protein